MKYAHIDGGEVREVWVTDQRRKPDESPAHVVGMPDCMDIRPVKDSVDQGWTVDADGKFEPPAEIADDHAARARHVLAATDRVAVRCVEDGLEYPGAWRAYRAALRQIVSTGDLPESGWPEQPEYPAAT